MLDPLLCCYIIATMKHAGYFIDVGSLVRWVKAHGRAICAMGAVGALRAAATPKRTTTATPARGTWSPPTGRAPVVPRTPEELAQHWVEHVTQNLARLETYVASMA
jgi:hypothetical protein